MNKCAYELPCKGKCNFDSGERERRRWQAMSTVNVLTRSRLELSRYKHYIYAENGWGAAYSNWPGRVPACKTQDQYYTWHYPPDKVGVFTDYHPCRPHSGPAMNRWMQTPNSEHLMTVTWRGMGPPIFKAWVPSGTVNGIPVYYPLYFPSHSPLSMSSPLWETWPISPDTAPSPPSWSLESSTSGTSSTSYLSSSGGGFGGCWREEQGVGAGRRRVVLNTRCIRLHVRGRWSLYACFPTLATIRNGPYLLSSNVFEGRSVMMCGPSR